MLGFSEGKDEVLLIMFLDLSDKQVSLAFVAWVTMLISQPVILKNE